MNILGAYLIFLFATVAVWFLSLAVYNQLTGTRLQEQPYFQACTGGSILFVAFVSFIPFPGGYLASLFVWGWVVWGGLRMSLLKGGLLFLILAVMSMIARLVALGVLNF